MSLKRWGRIRQRDGSGKGPGLQGFGKRTHGGGVGGGGGGGGGGGSGWQGGRGGGCAIGEGRGKVKDLHELYIWVLYTDKQYHARHQSLYSLNKGASADKRFTAVVFVAMPWQLSSNMNLTVLGRNVAMWVDKLSLRKYPAASTKTTWMFKWNINAIF